MANFLYKILFSRFFKPKFNFWSDEDLTPTRSTIGSAGFDLRANLEPDEVVCLLPGQSYVFDTGVTLEPLEDGWMALVYSRSGLSTKNKIMLLNGVAVIDPDYRGTIHAPLINMGNEKLIIKRGDRIAQLCFCPFAVPVLTRLSPDKMSRTDRGTGGFGHTGVS